MVCFRVRGVGMWGVVSPDRSAPIISGSSLPPHISTPIHPKQHPKHRSAPAVEVGLVLLREPGPADGVLLVVLEDAARRVQRHVHALLFSSVVCVWWIVIIG